MQRDLSRLAGNTYDLCVVGGGIYGACVAWDATLRGLSVALVEKGDFASATSANSLKTIHGGFRYLQHADFGRMREAIGERRNLMLIAPHLVHPLPVLIPTYRHWMQNKSLLSLALKVNDLVAFDRNRRSHPDKRIPRGHLISRRDVLDIAPGIEDQHLTGGMVFYDAQVYNSERLVLSFIKAAARRGADVANYAEAVGFLRQGDRAGGVEVVDSLTGDSFPVRARAVVNTCGPWTNRILSLVSGRPGPPAVPFAKAINLATRPLFSQYAVGVPGKDRYRDADAVVSKGNRLFFVAPWRGRSLVGTAYLPFEGDPDSFHVTEEDVAGFLEQVNHALPAAGLTMDDVSLVHGGLVLGSGDEATAGDVQRGKRSQIIDHGPHGLKGVVSVVGVKYTTARSLAEKVVDQVFLALGKGAPKPQTATMPVYGGDIPGFEAFLQAETRKMPALVDQAAAERLLRNYGSAYGQVLQYLEAGPPDGQDAVGVSLRELAVWEAEVRHGVREEMARKLADVVFRRTEMGSAGHPGEYLLQACARTMSVELGWDSGRMAQEIREVEERWRPTRAAVLAAPKI
jgi:glycerol-3-phosphate dehydrogenase